MDACIVMEYVTWEASYIHLKLVSCANSSTFNWSVQIINLFFAKYRRTIFNCEILLIANCEVQWSVAIKRNAKENLRNQ